MAAPSYDAGSPACFKAYDIRGIVPQDIDETFAFKLGLACRTAFEPVKAVIGHDARLSSPALAAALADGLETAGINTSTLGLCGTEEIYHAAANGDYDLGIMVTGSHNPADQNGFKFVLRGGVPVSAANGLATIERAMRGSGQARASSPRKARAASHRQDYVQWLCEYAAPDKNGKRLRVVANAGNGSAGPLLEELGGKLPFEFIPLYYQPDGNFPNGIPNPLLPERRADTSKAVAEAGADAGVAFDGDFDRCFFYDERGNFIEGYYLVGILASALLSENPGEKIVHDPRLYWNTREMILKAGGIPVMGKTGHSLIKAKMREVNALYGGEMSSHHYFRDFAYCDSGMLTMLLTLRYLQKSCKTLSEIVAGRMAAYPCSGEINFKVGNPDRAMEEIWKAYLPLSTYQDRLDGINLEFRDWRFSLRASNTEPLLRLNVESRGDSALMEDKAGELSALISKF